MQADQTTGLKLCPSCNEQKPLDAFGKSKRRADGLDVYCKDCHNRKQRERYQSDPAIGRAKRAQVKARLEKHPELREKTRAYYKGRRANDPAYAEHLREQDRERYRANPERGYAKARRAWGAIKADPERYQEVIANHADYVRERYKTDPEFREHVRAYFKRRAAIRRANGGRFAQERWEELCAMAGNRCVACGADEPLEIDHIVPVTEGGSGNLANLQPLCRSCNASKGTTMVDYRTEQMRAFAARKN